VRSLCFLCGFGSVSWPGGDRVGYEEVWCFACGFGNASSFAHLSGWDFGVVFAVAVLQL